MSQITPNQAQHKSRVVDLGREEEYIPWAEWFARTSASMEQLVKAGQAPDGPRVFRVTLQDGRPFAVMSVQTHIARGKCELVPNRWSEGGVGPGGRMEAICDVITGYTLVGAGPDGRPAVVSVPPREIASVECVVMVPMPGMEGMDEGDGTMPEPFGFAAFKQRLEKPEVKEVEEPTLFSQKAAELKQ
ncbi:MAG: hypothetical protein KDA20_03425 [Phycisphaerales bacterium]|nr:hypothetical protein [Phycisphaerales bacterium]